MKKTILTAALMAALLVISGVAVFAQHIEIDTQCGCTCGGKCAYSDCTACPVHMGTCYQTGSGVTCMICACRPQ